MLRFTYDGHMYLYTHIYIYVSDQATMPLVWNLMKWLFLLWVLIYVCTIFCSCFMQFSSFSHTIIPHLYIFTPIFIVSPNSLGLMLFVCNWCAKKIKVYLILSYLILSYYDNNLSSGRQGDMRYWCIYYAPTSYLARWWQRLHDISNSRLRSHMPPISG